MLSAELTTSRLRIRMPAGRDIGAITEACQDPEIQRFTTVPAPYTRAHAQEFVARCAGAWVDGTDAVWVLEDDGVLVGMIGLHHISDGVAELGYWTAAPARGQGYLVEAAKAVLDWGFAEPLTLRRVRWRAVVGNVASARAARALGFRYEGTARAALRHGEHIDDAWTAGLLPGDDRTPALWPILE